MSLRIGYARTSTLDQKAGFEAQLKSLEAAGCSKIFREQVSSVQKRPELERALDYLRDGDTLVVTKLDRLARSTAHLLALSETIQEKGANLQVLDLNLDTSTPTGKLLFTMIGAIGQFEREMMLERQREGIAKAKEEGKYKGRKPVAKAKADEVLSLKAEGMGPMEISRRLGIGRSSVYRILEDATQ
ncbi:recombinase family protein [Fodinicurvata fenggangensis]|uniref:recombinase family protein n=1 Tax=Fodinicurvata fenggangensis TaxID=1121830 RepID=UPI00054E92A0|nr:recombinase family protein [Fodinicurvata fenggangensis]